MVAFAKENHIDLTVVAPDDPLAAGMVDRLEEAGLRAFGPSAKAAEIEASKVYAKELMRKYNIPTAGYEVFDDPTKALDYIKTQGTYPAVIKAEGLALGKGVVLAKDFEEAKEAVENMIASQNLWRFRAPCCGGRIFDRAGGVCAGVYGRQNGGADGERAGP